MGGRPHHLLTYCRRYGGRGSVVRAAAAGGAVLPGRQVALLLLLLLLLLLWRHGDVVGELDRSAPAEIESTKVR